MSGRDGTGTVISFQTTRMGYFLHFFRESGLRTQRIIEDELAKRLAELYGVRDPSGQTIAMSPLKGAAFRYHETSQGLLTHIEILPS